MIKDLETCIKLSLKANESKEYTCNVDLVIEGNIWKAHTVTISHRDIMFYCNEGDVTYLVDSYGDKHLAVLHDWNNDDIEVISI